MRWFFWTAALTLALCGSAWSEEGGGHSYQKSKFGRPHGAIELAVNGAPHKGDLFFHRPASRSGSAGASRRRQALYAVQVRPGGAYTLGLTFPAITQKFTVSFYDRSPWDPGAKRATLPSGPVVKTNLKAHRCFWQFSLSPKSTGALLHISIEVSPLERDVSLPHTIFIASPPVVSRQVVGQGITFLQGPSNFFLSGDEIPFVASAEEKEEPRRLVIASLDGPGDRIRNGGFREGLNGWQPTRDGNPVDAFSSVSVQAETLRLRCPAACGREGVRQALNLDVSDAVSLLLQAEIKVEEQTLGGTGPRGRQAPVVLSVGYLDTEGKERLDEDAYRVCFYALDPESPDETLNGQRVEQGRWFHFQTDLMQIEPKPKAIRYLAIEGDGWPVREAWVREIHLIESGAEK